MVDALCAPLAVLVSLVAALLAALRRPTPVEPPVPVDPRPLALPCLSMVDPVYTWTDANVKQLTETEVKAWYALRSIGAVKADYAKNAWIDADGNDLEVKLLAPVRIVGSDGKLAYLLAAYKTNRPGVHMVILADRAIGWHGRCAALVAAEG